VFKEVLNEKEQKREDFNIAELDTGAVGILF